MGKLKDITGNKYGRLVVIGYAGRTKDRHSLWKCVCDCGNTKTIIGNSMKRGDTTSCGCYAKEVEFSQHNGLKHGMATTRAYNIWAQMIQRCINPKNKNYRLYGERGIAYCEKWQTFEGFWADMQNGYSDTLTLDREDVNGNYEKSNCRWATQKEQGNNTRINHTITYGGLTLTLSQFADKYNMSKETLWYRIKSGWGIERALSTPVRHPKNYRRVS
ncbi:MAG: hypothetical protein WC476_13570 [Phycisphaerae bacterium]|jgi:hypothetical protein